MDLEDEEMLDPQNKVEQNQNLDNGGICFADPSNIMTTLSWNCQGLRLPWKVQFLADVMSQEKPTFVFLCETINRKERMKWIRNKLGFEGMIVVEPHGRSGGSTLLWREQDQSKLLSLSQNHTDVETSVER